MIRPDAAAAAYLPAAPRTVRVWDPVVRLFHWTVVTGAVLNLFVLAPGKTAHQAVGYVIAGALLIRLAWGFVGSRHARFADFFPTPRRLGPYLGALRRGRAPRSLGHNPAGAVMMLLLMALLAGTAVTGWMSTLDAFWGVRWVGGLHATLANAIMVLALLHAAAALFESWRHRENLVWSMVTGRKRG
jgi:cytochrome b